MDAPDILYLSAQMQVSNCLCPGTCMAVGGNRVEGIFMSFAFAMA